MEKEFNDTIQNIIKIMDLSEDITQIQDKDCVAFEISKNNILLMPENKFDIINSLYYQTYTNALRIVKIPKGSTIDTNPSYKHIKCSNKEYLTHRLSPYTYPECILIKNIDTHTFIVANKDAAIKLVKEADCSN